MTTEIVFVLDRSGSMRSLESDVIGGFNSFLSEQQKLKDEARLTTILFDNEYEVLHDGLDIQNVKPITPKEYFVRGTTALLDAVGKAISVAKSHAKKKDKVLFIINTDGYENSSKEYTNEQIKELVKKCEKKDNWKFIFLGAGIDSFAVGGSMGFTMTGNYSNSSKGYACLYNTTTDMVSTFRSTGNVSAEKLKDLE
jgi:uncharacterized protein YegL